MVGLDVYKMFSLRAVDEYARTPPTSGLTASNNDMIFHSVHARSGACSQATPLMVAVWIAVLPAGAERNRQGSARKARKPVSPVVVVHAEQ
jgi:hypothetical protein